MIRRRAALAAAALLPAAVLACFFACGGSEFTTEPAGGDDSGARDSALPALDSGAAADAHDAGPAIDSASPGDSSTTSPDTGATVPDAGGMSVVYVSAAGGSDSNTGFSSTSPKQTIAAAIAAAAALDGGVEVHACAGTYDETSLTLASPVSLRGAYDCTTWTRTPTFGFPTFDGVNATIIENASPASQGETLLVQVGVSPATLVDGLDVVGAPALDSATTGILVRGNALLSDLEISGGGALGDELRFDRPQHRGGGRARGARLRDQRRLGGGIARQHRDLHRLDRPAVRPRQRRLRGPGDGGGRRHCHVGNRHRDVGRGGQRDHRQHRHRLRLAGGGGLLRRRSGDRP